MNATPVAQQQQKKTSFLSRVRSGKERGPHRIVLYGPEGVGKSTFAMNAPSPVTIPVEDGARHLDTKKTETPSSWRDVLEIIRELRDDEHPYKTVSIDTLDALEALLWRHMVERDRTDEKGKPLRDITSYGYGKGYDKALEDWRQLLRGLEQLGRKGMHVVLLAHSQVKAFKNPAGDDFDRYELKLNAKASGLMKEWADSVLFANYETFARKDERTKRSKGVDSGARLIFTQRRAAYDAKHRGNLPETLPLSWVDFEAAAATEVDAVALAAEILKKAAELGEETAQLVAATVTKAAGNVESLLQINNRVNTRLAEKAANEES